MPVGAGSIKRAAKAAETVKKSGTKSTDKKAEKNAGKKESERAVSRQKKESVKKTEKPAQRYEAYGVGQPLPVHLL